MPKQPKLIRKVTTEIYEDDLEPDDDEPDELDDDEEEDDEELKPTPRKR